MSLTLLAIFAHPDDESGCSGTLAMAVARGWRVVFACATRGEEGEIADPVLATQENLWQVREREMRCALKVLGIDEVYFLDYCDSGMAGTPPNDNPKSFMQADSEMIHRQLVQLIRDIKPHTILTFEPYGVYGHPDHIAISKFTTDAFDLAGQSGAFPETGDPWQAQRLFYMAMSIDWFERARDLMAMMNLDTSGFENLAQYLKPALDRQISHRLDVSEFVPRKMESLSCHRTQIGPNSAFYHLMKSEFHALHREESFIQVRPASPILDFFGLDESDNKYFQLNET